MSRIFGATPVASALGLPSGTTPKGKARIDTQTEWAETGAIHRTEHNLQGRSSEYQRQKVRKQARKS